MLPRLPDDGMQVTAYMNLRRLKTRTSAASRLAIQTPLFDLASGVGLTNDSSSMPVVSITIPLWLGFGCRCVYGEPIIPTKIPTENVTRASARFFVSFASSDSGLRVHLSRANAAKTTIM